MHEEIVPCVLHLLFLVLYFRTCKVTGFHEGISLIHNLIDGAFVTFDLLLKFLQREDKRELSNNHQVNESHKHHLLHFTAILMDTEEGY